MAPGVVTKRRNNLLLDKQEGPVTCYRLPVTSCQSPVASYRLPVTGDRRPVTNDMTQSLKCRSYIVNTKKNSVFTLYLKVLLNTFTTKWKTTNSLLHEY